MPRRELRHPRQVVEWLEDMGRQLKLPGSMVLIGSGGLLWHAAQRGIEEPLPENSMDVDPVSDSDEIIRLCYEALVGSEFERTHGWHVNLMPDSVLLELPVHWQARASKHSYGNLTVVVPAPVDLLAPKLRRNEPRDRAHADWSKRLGMVA